MASAASDQDEVGASLVYSCEGLDELFCNSVAVHRDGYMRELWELDASFALIFDDRLNVCDCFGVVGRQDCDTFKPLGP